MASLPALPQDIDGARLPAVYEEAKRALAECSRIDECVEWANKAEAIASYARQSKDESLQKMAVRIQARAIRRCGELLKFFQTGPKAGRPKENGGGTPTISQRAAGSAAGLSKDQIVTASRVARVPAADFERQIASDKPPTVTSFAQQGKKKALVDLGTINTTDFAHAGRAIGQLKQFAEFASAHDPARVAAGMKDHEKAAARRNIVAIDSWLDRLIVAL